MKLSRKPVRITGKHLGTHAASALAETNALDRDLEIATFQEWLGHTNASATRIDNH